MSEATGTPAQDPDGVPDREVPPPARPGGTSSAPPPPPGPGAQPQRQPPGVAPSGPPQGPPVYPQQPYQGPPQSYPTYPQQPGHGPPAQVGYPAPPGGVPGYGYGPPPGWSDKTKLAAGLLQLLPGLIVAIGGIGRLYSGHTALGVVHLVLSIVGWALTPVLIGIPLVVACWIWAVVDGIVLLAGQPRDGQGLLMP